MAKRKNKNVDFVGSAQKYPELHQRTGDEGLSLPSRRLLSFLHNLPPVVTFPVPTHTPWDAILYDESVPLCVNHESNAKKNGAKSSKNRATKSGSKNDAKSSAKINESFVAALSSTQLEDNWFLNVGAPVWALDISAPFQVNLPKSKNRKKSQNERKSDVVSNFSVVAVGLAPRNQPISVATAEGLDGAGVIELWRVSEDSETPPRMVCGLIHNGRFCRSLSWVRYSGDPGKIGLLFSVLGDGSLNCFSIPADPFLDGDVERTGFGYCTTELFKLIPPIWYLPPRTNVHFTCVSPAPFFVDPESVYAEHGPDDSAACLHVAAGCRDGRVFVWHITNSLTSFNNPVIYPIYDKNAVTCIAWAPIPDMAMFAVSSSEGRVRVWDTRLILDGSLVDMDNTRRPVYQISWPPISRFLLISHASALIYNSVKQEGTNCNGQGDRPSWSCSSFGNIALFAFDDGRLLMQPMNSLDKRCQSYTVVITWSYIAEKPNGIKQAPVLHPCASTQMTGELTPKMLDAFYSEATQFYARGSMNRSRGLSIQIGSDPPKCKQKKGTPLRDILEDYISNARLHAVTALDPLVYPDFAWPFVAYGGDSGIVHLFSPRNTMTRA